ncbi:MAG TPA: hypothetical protein P5038_16300 [Candidatus Paceibacterota bacterium]|nr:hypothetical protein [Candidatus Paceibacterota bacterium]HRT58188.1 hypothetical protein [Candidatus Paceibacterota bacterium]
MREVTATLSCILGLESWVDLLPIDLGALSASPDEKELLSLADALMADLKNNSVNRTLSFQHDTLTVQCIYPKTSKPIIDRIEQALARHYGFTNEELDSLLNYDIKFRLSLGAEGDGEE